MLKILAYKQSANNIVLLLFYGYTIGKLPFSAQPTSFISLWKKHINILYTFPCQKSANKNKKRKQNKKKEQKHQQKNKYGNRFSVFIFLFLLCVFFCGKLATTYREKKTQGKQKLNKQNQPLYKPPCPCFLSNYYYKMESFLLSKLLSKVTFLWNLLE